MGSRTVVDRPLAVVDLVNTASPVTYWISVDHLNRPIQMFNAAKASVWQAVWLPWGGVQSVTGTATLNARFPGQWFQSETGLHYNWHRSYDPTLGRYTQPDPLGFVDGPSVYGYAKGSPLRYVDFRGLSDDDGVVIPFPVPKPPPLPIPKKDRVIKYIKGCIKWAIDKIAPPPPPDDCAVEQLNLINVKTEFKLRYMNADEFTKNALREQILTINENIAFHNQKCPAHQVDPLTAPGKG